MDEKDREIIRRGAEAWRRILDAESAEMKQARERFGAAHEAMKKAVLELFSAQSELEAQPLREAGDSEEEIAAWALDADEAVRVREEVLQEINHISYDIPTAAWWTLSEIWDVLGLIYREPVNKDTLALNKWRREELEDKS